MSETNGNGRPISPLLRELIAHIRAQFERNIQDAVKLAMAEASVPEGTRLDLERGVWVLPDPTLADVP